MPPKSSRGREKKQQPRALTTSDVNLLDAVSNSNIDSVYSSMWDNANVEAKYPVSLASPLSIAVKTNKALVVKILLEFGANPAATDSYGATPLHWASLSNDSTSQEILQALIARANSKGLSSRDSFGSTPLHFATVENNEGAVLALLEHGADPTITNNDNRKPSDITTSDIIRAALIESEIRIAAANSAKQAKPKKAKNGAKSGSMKKKGSVSAAAAKKTKSTPDLKPKTPPVPATPQSASEASAVALPPLPIAKPQPEALLPVEPSAVRDEETPTQPLPISSAYPKQGSLRALKSKSTPKVSSSNESVNRSNVSLRSMVGETKKVSVFTYAALETPDVLIQAKDRNGFKSSEKIGGSSRSSDRIGGISSKEDISGSRSVGGSKSRMATRVKSQTFQ
ncbi:hypothetical protein SmJEL517_g03912 [Synchytrium microbalum]|uniref:Uncharacterized protein n=1 Tax=Synchytrium microbalum TaxID=1806994 RepID=A0A507BW85_9FUNG|nr:uncharacterized protein SmJEL517_g03912 [Synchytrium microbalum]TPX33107.1 hypothetical protein SmJEL517_g03912 [Synchytrium microbalum]